MEDALLHHFGTTLGAPGGLTLRDDNGLVFGSKAYRAHVRDYGLTQDSKRSGDNQPKDAPRASAARQYTDSDTPEQNGLCERFIRTFKEECAWQKHFENLTAARTTVARYIEHDNTQRRHSALNYNTPPQTYLTPCTPPHQEAA